MDQIECLRCGQSVERTHNRQVYCKPCAEIERAEYYAAYKVGHAAYYNYRRHMRITYGSGPWPPDQVEPEDRWPVWIAVRNGQAAAVNA